MLRVAISKPFGAPPPRVSLPAAFCSSCPREPTKCPEGSFAPSPPPFSSLEESPHANTHLLPPSISLAEPPPASPFARVPPAPAAQMSAKDSIVPTLRVCNCAGGAISETQLDTAAQAPGTASERGRLVTMGWTDGEMLVMVRERGGVEVRDIMVSFF